MKKKGLLLCIICLIVLFSLFLFRPVYHLTTDNEIIQFINKHETLLQSVFNEMKAGPNIIRKYEPFASSDVKRIFRNSTITRIVYNHQEDTFTFISSEFGILPETDEYLIYALDIDMLELGREHRIFESEWHFEQMDDSTIQWTSGTKYILVKMLLPNWYHIYCYLPT